MVLFALGLGLWFIAWWRAGNTRDKAASRAQVLGGLAGGVLTGAVVTLGMLLLQQWLEASSENAFWQASVGTAANIPGFTPGSHSMQGMNLSGKQLQDADLRGKNLTHVQLRDANLTGADLTGADFHGDIMFSANLSETVLKGADLSDAQIQGVQFVHADIYSIGSLKGAKANNATCWPHGFLKIAIAKGVKATEYHDALGNITKSRGREYPDCGKAS